MTLVRMGAVVAVVLAVGINSHLAYAAEPVLAAGAVFEDWTVECEQRPQDNRRICFLTQTLIATESKERLLKLSIGRFGAANELMAIGILPLGISIPAGVTLRVDGLAPTPLHVQRCTAEGCLAATALDKALADRLYAGKEIEIEIVPYGGREVSTIRIALRGYAAGYTALKL
ncbi:exported hypothetical protein [uncultured Gammaproteobacteria bacterium]